jgi:hypothetical protein
MTIDVDQDEPEDERSTLLEVGVWPTEAGVRQRPACWSGQYWVKDSKDGPIMTPAE